MANPKPTGGQETRFQPGSSGNPGGKPKAARNALNASFIKALSKDFDTHGVAAIERVREEDPAAYIRVLAALVPKEIEVTTDPVNALSDDELVRAVELLRSAIAAGALGEGTAPAAAPPASPAEPAVVH